MIKSRGLHNTKQITVWPKRKIHTYASALIIVFRYVSEYTFNPTKAGSDVAIRRLQRKHPKRKWRHCWRAKRTGLRRRTILDESISNDVSSMENTKAPSRNWSDYSEASSSCNCPDAENEILSAAGLLADCSNPKSNPCFDQAARYRERVYISQLPTSYQIQHWDFLCS